MKYKNLRQKYPEFVYKSFDWKINKKNLEIEFKFVCHGYSFNPKLVYKNVNTSDAKRKKIYIDILVFNIGLVELLSYWKAFCSPKIKVEAGGLDEFQKAWWKKLLLNGMGEYFYENEIDFTKKDFVEISSTKSETTVKPFLCQGERMLVPVGGGKDSSVTLELLSKHFSKVDAFVVNSTKAQAASAKTAGVGKIEAERTLDPLIIELNKEGFLNGHTPFSALLSFTSLLAAVLGDFKFLPFSNEASSDEENIKYLGQKINHQYSKSFEFENDFREYNQKYLSNINYFSFLRPIYDIQIVKIFSAFSKYHSAIRSCNVGQKTDSWCGKCSKCLSTYMLFYPYMRHSAANIFGRDLLKDKSLKPIYKSLIDKNKVKPFECVGTRHELRVAMGLEKDNKLLEYWGENNLPPEFKMLLYFNLNFRNKKILILGYGREGKSTVRAINMYLPRQKYNIADKKINKNYLKNLAKYDVVFKSPGIPNKIPEIIVAKKKGVNFTSQTKIFLKLFRNNIIGVTGTKGKSTTVSLIHHIMRSNGLDCELVGNIGRPVFDHIKGFETDKNYVFEFSSHQLSDTSISPHIALLLNIFPEHLDYYENFQDYKKAKENIFKYQVKGDLFFSENEIKKLRLPKFKTILRGKHNIANIKAAFLVARELGLTGKQIVSAIKDFRPLKDRLEIVGSFGGVTFINDGLATIPQATIAAAKSFSDKKLTLILGGYDRGISFEEFAKEIGKVKNVINAVLIGQTADKIEKSLKKHSKIDTYNLGFSKMTKIVKKAYDVTKPKGVVLLSPGATSFDMFKDYRDRDRQFKYSIRRLS